MLLGFKSYLEILATKMVLKASSVSVDNVVMMYTAGISNRMNSALAIELSAPLYYYTNKIPHRETNQYICMFTI